jgi:WD40 repeat protein
LGITLSTDGATLYTASADGTARAWDTRTGETTFTFKDHTESVRAVTLSPNGATLYTASDDRTARAWDTKTGEPTFTFQGHSRVVRAVTLSPNGATLYTGSEDTTARAWDTTTGEATCTFPGHTASVHSVTLSADGTALYTASHDGTARAWDAGEAPGSLAFFEEGEQSLAFMDGRPRETVQAGETVRALTQRFGLAAVFLAGEEERLDDAHVLVKSEPDNKPAKKRS